MPSCGSRRLSSVVVDQRIEDRGDERLALRLADGARDVVRRRSTSVIVALVVVDVDVLELELVAGLDGEVLGDREAEGEAAAGRLVVVGAEVALVVVAAEDVDARRNPPAEEIRIGEAELVGPRVRAAADRDAQIVAAAEEVPLGQRDIADDAVRPSNSRRRTRTRPSAAPRPRRPRRRGPATSPAR